LEVAADNAPALGLYKSLEFEQVGRRSGYYQRRDGTQCDALILRKSLT
jgi:ribosomal-protein-alanine N-acetyltransferase